MRHVFFGILSLFIFLQVQAAPPALTYQGRILRSDGTPLENGNVSFIFQVTDPSGQCVIYSEQVNGINMSNSGGVFDVPIGSGSVSYPTGGSFTVLDAFNNSTSFVCSGGSPYNPVSTDGRLLKVQFYDGSEWRLITPDSVIRSVPFAGYSVSAQKLGSNTVADFVLKNDVNNPGSGSVSCDSGNFLTWDASTKKFGCAAVSGASGGTVTNVSSANSYLSVSNGSAAPVLTVNVGTVAGTVAAGNDSRLVNAVLTGSTAGGDLAGTYPNPSVVNIYNVPLQFSSLMSGQYLKYNGSQWVNANISQSDVTGLSTTLSGVVMQSQFPASCAANQTLTFISPSGSFSCSSIAINGSQVSGNISGNAAGFTGSLAGDVSGTQASTSVDKIKGVAVSATAPTSNQVLQYNGTNWAPATISTTPSGSAGGDLTGTYPNPTLAAVTTAGTGTKITYDAKGRVTASTTLSAADIPSLDWSKITSGTPTTLSGYGITDAVQNLSGTPGVQTGLDAAKPSSPTAGTLYFATDTQKIYQYNSGAWSLMGAASTGVSSQWTTTGSDIYYSTGKVGIGSSAPAHPLDVVGDVYSTTAFYAPAGYISKNYTQSQSAATPGYSFVYSSDSGMFEAGSAGSHAIGFSTAGSERMRIDSSGNVGVGTTTPGSPLDVSGTIRADALCDRTGANCKTISTGWTSTGAATSMTATWPDAIRCSADSSNSVVLYYNRTTSTPEVVYWDAGAYYALKFTPAGAYSGNTNLYSGGPTNCVSQSLSTLTSNGQTYLLAGGGGNIWTLNSTNAYYLGGNVGIGTASPSQALEVAGSGAVALNRAIIPTAGQQIGNVRLLGGNSSSATSSSVYAMLQGIAESPTAGAEAGALAIQLSSAGTLSEKLRITSAGNVGIGTASPSQALEVNGNIKGTQLCIGTDCRSAWPGSGGGGTVTSVGAGTGLTGGPITSSGTLAVDVGTTANKIVQLDASAKLPAVDGSALTNLNASNLTSGTVAAARMPALTGDVTTSAGSVATTLAKIQGTTLTVSSLASGNYLKYNGTAWVNATPSSADLSDASSLIKSSQMPANCAAGQTLTFSSPTGTWTCSNIVVTASNFGSQTANTFLAAPNGSAGTPTFRTISAADLPSSTLSGSGTAGYVPYYSAATTLANSVIYQSGSNVGIGTTSPGFPLDVTTSSASNGGIISRFTQPSLPAAGTTYLKFGVDTTTNYDAADIKFTYSGSGSSSNSFGIGFQGAGSMFTILGNGNVGIGTTNPGALFEVQKNQAANTNLMVTNTNSGGKAQCLATNGTNYTWMYQSGAVNGLSGFGTDSSGGFYNQINNNSGDFVWTTGTGATERMRLTSAGYLGFGTASPLAKFVVSGAGGNGSSFMIEDTSAAANLKRFRIYTQTGVTYFDDPNDSYSGVGHNPLIAINHSSGNVGVGIISPSAGRLDVRAPAGSGGIYGYTADGGSSYYGVIGASAGGSYGALGRSDGYAFVGSGAVWATGAGNFNQSDGRYKEHVEPLQNSLETIMKLRPVTYQWKPDTEAFKSTGDKTQYGLIAQEVKKVIPDIVILNKKPPVSPSKDGKKTLDEKLGESYGVEYTKIIPFLISSVQHIWTEVKSFMGNQQQVNDQVKRDLASMQSQLEKLNQENAALKSLVCKDHPEAEICH